MKNDSSSEILGEGETLRHPLHRHHPIIPHASDLRDAHRWEMPARRETNRITSCAFWLNIWLSENYGSEDSKKTVTLNVTRTTWLYKSGFLKYFTVSIFAWFYQDTWKVRLVRILTLDFWSPSIFNATLYICSLPGDMWLYDRLYQEFSGDSAARSPWTGSLLTVISHLVCLPVFFGHKSLSYHLYLALSEVSRLPQITKVRFAILVSKSYSYLTLVSRSHPQKYNLYMNEAYLSLMFST